jgi:hypothetical protein
MAVDFNHTIVWAQDSQASATFLAEVLGLPAPRQWGPFLVVTTDNGTNIDFMNAGGEITPQHYAFLSPAHTAATAARHDLVVHPALLAVTDPGRLESAKAAAEVVLSTSGVLEYR